MADDFDRAELEAARELARLLDGGGRAEGELGGLLETAALVQSLGPGTEDPAGLEEVRRRLQRRVSGRHLGLVAIAAAAALFVFLPGQPPPGVRPPPELAALEWPLLSPRPLPSELHRRGRLRVSRLAGRGPDRRKPWSRRFARDS